jgi:hypothetical protein
LFVLSRAFPVLSATFQGYLVGDPCEPHQNYVTLIGGPFYVTPLNGPLHFKEEVEEVFVVCGRLFLFLSMSDHLATTEPHGPKQFVAVRPALAPSGRSALATEFALMPEMPKPLVCSDETLYVPPAIAGGVSGATLDQYLQDMQEMLRNLIVRLIAGMMKGIQDLVRQATGVSSRAAASRSVGGIRRLTHRPITVPVLRRPNSHHRSPSRPTYAEALAAVNHGFAL